MVGRAASQHARVRPANAHKTPPPTPPPSKHKQQQQQHRLTDLDDACAASARPLKSLPVAVPLLWGVIALELGEADAARPTLLRYCGAAAAVAASSTTAAQQLSRADALALARLLAVRVLAAAGRDPQGARSWLAKDAAPLLSAEQRRLLLAEVDEAEEAARAEDAALAAAAEAEEGLQSGNQGGPGTALAALLKATGAGAGGGGGGAVNGSAAAAVVPSAAVEVHAGSDLMTMTGEMPAADAEDLADAQASSGDDRAPWRSGGGGGGGSNGGSDQSSKYQQQRQQQQPVASQRPPPPPPSRQAEEEAARQARYDAAAATTNARPQPPSWRQWASDAWSSSPTVQSALSALNLEGATPGQVAAGAGAAALVAYSLWRERRAVKAAGRRAARAAAAALAQTAGMAFGFAAGGAPNPMAAAPRAQYGP